MGSRKGPRGPNKLTLERRRLALRAMEEASTKATRPGGLARMRQQLAREVLADMMMALVEMAQKAQAEFAEAKIKWADYLSIVKATADVAGMLAPYESPRLQSVTVTRSDPWDTMTDQELYQELRKRAAALKIAPPPAPMSIGVAPSQIVQRNE